MCTNQFNNTKLKYGFMAFLATCSIFACNAKAAVITIPDWSLAPDGSDTVANDDSSAFGETLASGDPEISYVVATFNWGAGSDAHLEWRLNGNRVELDISDDGNVKFHPGSFNLNQDMAGTSLTVIAKVDYDSSHGGGGDDTIQSLWFTPTSGSSEGSPDATVQANNSNMTFMRRTISNQSTPGTAGTSSITDMVILTGADATFANALSYAAVPEPTTTALLGLGGLTLILRRRR